MSLPERMLALLYGRSAGAWRLEELAGALGAAPAEAAAGLEALRRAGQRLETTPEGDVRLLRPVRLSPGLIERELAVRRVGRSVVCFEEVGSTNDVALSALAGGGDGLVVLAESQRAGRGRQGRRWLSEAGRNVLLSALLVEPEAGGLSAEALTIAAGVAVAEAVAGATGLACGLKWPNDVLVGGAKVAGVLVEARRDRGRRGLVVGVGINANAAPPAAEVDQPATSLAAELGEPVERVELVRGLLERLDGWVVRLAEPAGGAALHEAFLRRCRMVNTRVRVACGGVTYHGRVLDVDPLAGLVVACDDGATVRLPAGHSTILGGEAG